MSRNFSWSHSDVQMQAGRPRKLTTALLDAEDGSFIALGVEIQGVAIIDLPGRSMHSIPVDESELQTRLQRKGYPKRSSPFLVNTDTDGLHLSMESPKRHPKPSNLKISTKCVVRHLSISKHPGSSRFIYPTAVHHGSLDWRHRGQFTGNPEI